MPSKAINPTQAGHWNRGTQPNTCQDRDNSAHYPAIPCIGRCVRLVNPGREEQPNTCQQRDHGGCPHSHVFILSSCWSHVSLPPPFGLLGSSRGCRVTVSREPPTERYCVVVHPTGCQASDAVFREILWCARRSSARRRPAANAKPRGAQGGSRGNPALRVRSAPRRDPSGYPPQIAAVT